ncbi:MAG: hypothetical protein VKJ24_16735 [Synechococcales bacterium]|nr:hypothetical protein [Synechococcales bacterium]
MRQPFDPLPPQASPQALSVGNVVSAGFRLYSNHLQEYLTLAFRATGWTMIPLVTTFVVVIFLIAFAAAGTGTGTDNAGPIFISILLGLILAIPIFFLWIFCFAKFYTNTALISRLAYGALTNQPESIREGLQAIRAKMWNFWLVQFLIWGILVGVNFLFSFVQQILLILPAAFVGSGRDNTGTGIAAILIGLITFAIVLVQWGVQLWVSARLFIPELSIALEDRIGADKAIGRSWSLSKGHSLRIMLVLLVAGLITAPLYFLILIPMAVFLIGQVQRLASLSGLESPDPGTFVSFVIAIALGSILLTLLNIFVLPFWQAIKAVIYYDLRIRREGLGLELRDRT